MIDPTMGVIALMAGPFSGNRVTDDKGAAVRQILIAIAIAIGVGMISGVSGSVITTFVLKEQISNLDKRIEAERMDRIAQDNYILRRLDK